MFLLDMDGVLVNFIQGMIDSHGWDIEHDDVASWNFHYSLGLTDKEFWQPSYSTDWWLNLEPYPEAKQFWTSLSWISDVVFCTSPNMADPTCASQKAMWLKKHGFTGDYCIGPRKELLAGNGILIDDSENNVAKFRQAGGRAILFPRPWNRHKNESPYQYALWRACEEKTR